MVQAARGDGSARGEGWARGEGPAYGEGAARGDGPAHGEIVVKRHPEAVAEVRAFVRLMVGRWGVDDYVPCLVASELVTNAIVHPGGAASSVGAAGPPGHDEVILRLGLADDGALWLEVQDTGPGHGILRVPDADVTGESGRGLLVVDHLTRDWGVRPLAGDTGKVVFAVIGPPHR